MRANVENLKCLSKQTESFYRSHPQPPRGGSNFSHTSREDPSNVERKLHKFTTELVLLNCKERLMLSFYPSKFVNCMGIQPTATELAEENLPFAGRLKYFRNNCAKCPMEYKGREYCSLSNLISHTLQGCCMTSRWRRE